jgi:hypothetical protein
MNTEERAFWKNFVFVRIPLMCGAAVIASLCIAAMEVPLHFKPPEQLSWSEELWINKDRTPLALKGDWDSYYKQAALFGFRTGCSVVITFALLNAAIFRSNRRNESNDRT